MRHGSLFSGIGGFDLAAEWVGWENVFHCEWNEYNKQVLKKNFPNSNGHGDIQQFDAREYNGTIDIISGGFPCQDISIAQVSKGNHKGGAKGINGERSGLWKEYARVIREIRPRYIVFENSPMLTVRGLEHVLCDLTRMGYDAEWRMFYATQFGYNHRRKRIYGIAYPIGSRCEDYFNEGGILSKILPQRTPRQSPLPMSFKRYDSCSDYGSVRMDDGFPKELDKNRIYGCGNAIVTSIAYEIFKAISAYETLTTQPACDGFGGE
jgi:DNA (cytosine-5)-methyltransferase 1